MLCALRYNGVMEEYRNPFEWTPQSEAWVEAASWIAEEKRARLRDDPTESLRPPRLPTVHATDSRNRRSLVHLQDRLWAMSCSAAYESAERTTRSLVR